MKSYRKIDIQNILSKIDDIKDDISMLKKQTDFQSGMICPKCGSLNNTIYNTRENKQNFRIRSRKCLDCENRWNTLEIVTDFGIPDGRKNHG